MKKRLGIFGLFLMLVTNIYSFNISTTFFDRRIDVDEGYKEIILKNKTNEKIRYKVKVRKSDDKDMSKWIELSQKVVNIEPRGEKVLKIFAKAPKGTKAGEYSFNLQFESIVIPTISKQEEGKIKGSSTVSFTPIIKMFGYVGDAEFSKNIVAKDLKLQNINKKYRLTGSLANNAYAGKSIGFNFIGDNNFVVGGKWIGRFKPNEERKIDIESENRFKEISIYDGETNEEIKRVTVLNSN